MNMPITRKVIQKTTAITSARWIIEDGLCLADLKRIVADCEAAELPDSTPLIYFDSSRTSYGMNCLPYFSIQFQEVISEKNLSDE